MSAWLYRQKKSKYWWLGWRVGKKCHFRSTKQTDRKEAERELAKVQTLFTAHRAGTLDAVYEALSQRVIPKVTLKQALDQWLAEGSASTRERYDSIAEEFANYLGATDAK